MSTSHEHKSKSMPLLVLGALGIVYGDLGTSPLYTIRECFGGIHPLAPSPENVLGVLSLIFWAMTLIISVKYIVFVTKADNKGEGGELALMALAISKLPAERTRQRFLVMTLGLFGASLLYGDGMITPAISTLSAIEGLKMATPLFEPYVIPLTLVILTVLFLFQYRGTAQIGSVFGPIVLSWFALLGILGAVAVFKNLTVFYAINPIYALRFLMEMKMGAFLVLGSVFLALTGGEALYTDMGHFGRRPIQLGWYCVALPGLLLNYFGQGATILSHPEAVENPFYSLVPRWGIIPMVLVATAATIVASQAVISGAFSVTRQAVLLGYLPRISIVHTSSSEIGQIYVPVTNKILCIATLGLVLSFRTSSALAAAYGVAVTTTMIITTLLFYVVAREMWGWRRLTAGLLVGLFLTLEISFWGSALVKIPHGGWFPLLIAVTAFTLMSTWRKGRQILGERLYKRVLPLDQFVNCIVPNEPNLTRVPGAAIFMSGNPLSTPPVLLHNIKYNRVLHETVAIVNVVIEETPHVTHENRAKFEDLGHGFYRIQARYGFMESPSMKEILHVCADHGLNLDYSTVGYFLGRESILTTKNPGMSKWRQQVFAFMARNAQSATPFFEIPPNQVVELGVQVQL